MSEKIVLIAEKPSVAQEYAKALRLQNSKRSDGYIEGLSSWDNNYYYVTWAVGHLVALSYPDKYDEKYKKWNIDDLPFLPEKYKYEIIPSVKKQFGVVKKLYNSEISGIILGGDSGLEGYYIQCLILSMAGFNKNAWIKVLWIDSQTYEEILRGIKYAHSPAEPFFKNLKDEGYMRAIEDYAMGINFSRALSCKFGKEFNENIKSKKYTPISVGRVMTCVLGMVVDRENAIKSFKPIDYYRIEATYKGSDTFSAEWQAVEGSRYFNNTAAIYDKKGFYKESDADTFISMLESADKGLTVESVKKEKSKSYAPLLFNLADLQNECSKKFKISPDKTLEIAQKLYEGKLITYPRTDARVLTTAIAKVIDKTLDKLSKGSYKPSMAQRILDNSWYKELSKTKYVNDKKVTDHYAIIPTGQQENIEKPLGELEKMVYHLIVERFLSIFFPPAEFLKGDVILIHKTGERFFTSSKELIEKGFYEVTDNAPEDKKLPELESGQYLTPCSFDELKSTTKPPSRFTSGSMIIAMENAGNFIEDEDEQRLEELRSQLKGAGIGTSATRAEILKKLVNLKYLNLNSKTQVYTPTDIGYAVYKIVKEHIPAMLSPKMTASWQQGLSQIERGEVTRAEFKAKLDSFVRQKVESIR